jgi:hypothetical protein
MEREIVHVLRRRHDVGPCRLVDDQDAQALSTCRARAAPRTKGGGIRRRRHGGAAG